MEPERKRVGVYLRVSTKEQAEHGWRLEGQYAEIRKYSDRQEGWKVTRVFNDPELSAKDLSHFRDKAGWRGF